MKTLFRFLPVLAGLLLGPISGSFAASSPVELRAAAKRDFDSGNWKDALEIYERMLKDPAAAGEALADDFGKAVECQNRLGQPTGFDKMAEAAVAAHPKEWRM